MHDCLPTNRRSLYVHQEWKEEKIYITNSGLIVRENSGLIVREY